MNTLSLAGVIGTWIGASVGIVALVGIVGPFLAWRAKRTERFKAIAAVAQNSNGFISAGIPIWPNIRVYRRVRVPLLRREPDFTTLKFGWDIQRIPEQTSSSSWVQLGTLLRAYNAVVPVGDELEIHSAETHLRVRRAWILLVGLLGRFSIRHDRGQVKRQETAVLGVPSPNSVLPPQPLDIRMMRNLDYSDDEKLYGITGTLEFSKDETSTTMRTTRVRISLAQKHSLEFEPEILSFTQIFMLSIGCIPMAGQVFFSLRHLSTFEINSFVEDTPNPQSPNLHESSRQMKSRLGIQTFRLKAVVERKADLVQLGKPFAAERAIIHSLESFIPTHE